VDADAKAAAIAGAIARGAALPPGTHDTDFRKAAKILEEAVRGFDIDADHDGQGMFWRGKTRDKFVATLPISGDTPIVPGKPDESALIDRTGRPQDDRGGMPRFRPRIPQVRREFLKDWITRGAPDNVPGGEIGIAAEPTPPREPSVAPPPPPAGLSFERDIKPLFRDKDRNRMLFKFDLFKYDDVKQNADKILGAVSSGRMPCDIPWDSNKVATFKTWMDGGLIA
jgi:hypothetical protein